jgi:GSCFA family
MSNPYASLPPAAFWRPAVAERHPLDIDGLWVPKHRLLPTHRISTAGSCFAQHIGRALKARGYRWLDAEPAPPGLSEGLKRAFNYGVFSFRTGNIYTAALLRQWLSWSVGGVKPPDEFWHENGRVYDPFRPDIEPDGFADEAEAIASREATLRAIRRAVEESHTFVFTLGLTEAWVDKSRGHVYPMCPGTVHGTFRAEAHEFRNYRYPEIAKDLRESLNLMKATNPSLRFLLTVSPVPLTATASGRHVLVATTYSKSTLRAVAGDLAARSDTDYFGSYEIITASPFRGMFFEQNQRSVSPHGVEFVMRSFFAGLEAAFPGDAAKRPSRASGTDGQRASMSERDDRRPTDDVKCEEELLSAFEVR